MNGNFFSGATLATAALLSGLLGACSHGTPSESGATSGATAGNGSSGSAQAYTPAAARPQQVACESLPVFFATDSSQLDASGRARLTELANCLRNRPIGAIVVTARTDPRGTAANNEQLSAQRAETVAQFLRAQGFTGVRLSTRSEGENDMPNDPAQYPYERSASVYVRTAAR